MMGYVPQILPQSYIETRSFSGLGDTYSPPPLVQANASTGGSGGGGFLNFASNLIGGAFAAGAQGSMEFNTAAAQLDAQRLANERSRRWAAFGAVAVGIAGLAGVVYLLRK
ncbi:MAG: hypothetical protein EPN91_08610 [Salinibacterium sp.]|nr:MAG: hypothetical protein EPN91_08610 [Salinibacterium sp.]